MATKIICVCDQCGNDISSKKPNRYEVHKRQDDHNLAQSQAVQLYGQQQAAKGFFSAGGGLGGLAGPPSTPTVAYNYTLFEAELCDVCEPVWLQRVKNLTQKSDPS